MKRSPLLRRSPLRRAKPLARVNVQRRAKRRALAFAEQARTCRHLPCLVCSSGWWSYPAWVSSAIKGIRARYEDWEVRCEPHHEPPRSCGGIDRHTVPLCTRHHRQRHDIGEAAFCREHNVDLRARAAFIHKELES